MQTQPWPRAWLLTDERMGDALDGALSRAAMAGAGVIVRHHGSPAAERRRIAEQVLVLGARLGISRDVDLARALGAAFVHNPIGHPAGLPFSLSVHKEEEALRAAHDRPAMVFVSPVYPTRSHPGEPALGPEKALHLARLSANPAYALGGIDAAAGERLIEEGWSGWAGIDAWL